MTNKKNQKNQRAVWRLVIRKNKITVQVRPVQSTKRFRPP
jgi:hypothetical protein